MLRISLLIAIVFFVLSYDVYAQDVSQRTQALVASLDKTKYKKKEKANISIEIYIDIKNEAALRDDPTSYSGVYDADNYRMRIDVGRDGIVTGEGYDSIGSMGQRTDFTLRDGRVQGALLTATKVYADGKTLPFEAAFVNRTVSNGKNANQIDTKNTMFGLGFIQTGADWTNRVFLERR